MSFTASMEFPGGVSANMFVSFGSANEQTFTASFEKGVLRVDDFTLPFEGDTVSYSISAHTITPNGTKLAVKQVTAVKEVEEDSTYQETQLWRDLEDALEKNDDLEKDQRRRAKTADQQKWADMSLKTQTVLDALVVSADQNGAFVPL
eukprot:TRINITY_DN50995_c0_g1_i1.p1 TRINITY_DN50995_c0_g1~~TRINITY_DN50995_c0_g1_i1.p1  ORF type:complete len:148 (-),score=42.36 TRINITY_DN50995_c0_g1_i1:191-634(-)